MSPSTDEKQPADEARDRKAKIQAQLDEALAASFPASDPISIVTSQTEEDWALEVPARK
jgi:uncharacterized protein (DUF1697 family)